MATKKRQIMTNSVHHVFSRGAKKMNIFHTPNDYVWFINKAFYLSHKDNVEILNFCLLPNHFHFVVREGDGDKSAYFKSHVSRFFHRLLSAYVQHYRHCNSEASGCVFQGEFQNVEIIGKKQFQTVMRYVDRNAVAAKLADKPADWPWSKAGMSW